MVPLKPDPFPFLPLLHFHFNTSVFQQDPVQGVRRDRKSMILFYLPPQVYIADGMNMKIHRNEESDFFRDNIRFLSRPLGYGDLSCFLMSIANVVNPFAEVSLTFS